MKIDLTSIDFANNNIHKRFDQSFITRYTIVAEIINQLRPSIKKSGKLKILDLGGYNGAARDLLSDKVTILDIFEDETLEDYIRVDSVGIPCEDDAFDIVISTDVMEHIEPKSRNLFLEDAIRVAKYATIIAAPFEHANGDVAYEELMSNSVYVGETEQDYIWLKEHRDYGLPQRQWIEGWLKEHNVSYSRFSHTSLRLWSELLAIGYFLANNVNAVDANLGKELLRLNDGYFKKISAIDFPKDGYRTFYVISKKFENIDIQLPDYDPKVITSFTSDCRIVFGSVFSKMSELLYEYQKETRKHIKREEKLKLEVERLTAVEEQYNTLKERPEYKIASKIKRIVTRG